NDAATLAAPARWKRRIGGEARIARSSEARSPNSTVSQVRPDVPCASVPSMRAHPTSAVVPVSLASRCRPAKPVAPVTTVETGAAPVWASVATKRSERIGERSDAGERERDTESAVRRNAGQRHRDGQVVKRDAAALAVEVRDDALLQEALVHEVEVEPVRATEAVVGRPDGHRTVDVIGIAGKPRQVFDDEALRPARIELHRPRPVAARGRD